MIADPTEQERYGARVMYPEAVVPDEGAVPDYHHDLTPKAVVGVPEWVVESVVARFERSDEPVTEDRLNDYALDYVLVSPEYFTEPGHEDLVDMVRRRVEGGDAGLSDNLVRRSTQDRPTLPGETGGTKVTIEVDVPRDVYEEAVETTKQLNAIPEEYRRGWSGPATLGSTLIDMIDLEIVYYWPDGEPIDEGSVYYDEAEDGDG